MPVQSFFQRKGVGLSILPNTNTDFLITTINDRPVCVSQEEDGIMGFVGFFKHESYYGKSYADLPFSFDEAVSGGFIYSQPFLPGVEGVEGDLWWFGFICSNSESSESVLSILSGVVGQIEKEE